MTHTHCVSVFLVAQTLYPRVLEPSMPWAIHLRLSLQLRPAALPHCLPQQPFPIMMLVADLRTAVRNTCYPRICF